MSELKPCPFCGGEATDYGSFVQCENEDCEVNPHAETIEAWNTRAERTCENKSDTGFLCSACSFGDFGGFHGYTPNYCPNCGARVIQ